MKTTYGEYYSESAVRARQRARIAAGRITTEELASLGFKGRGGYLGRGTYAAKGREAGYVRRGR